MGPELIYTVPPGFTEVSVGVRAEFADGSATSDEATLVLPPAELAVTNACIKVEAETFTGQGGGEINIYKPESVSGRAITYWHKDIGHWLEWTFEIPEAGHYNLFARYATGSHHAERDLMLDGKVPKDAYRRITFPWTGGWSGSQGVWRYRKLGPPVELAAGKHLMRMTNLRDGLGVDYFLLKRVP